MMLETAIDPWIIGEAAFPAKGSDADRLRFLLNYAVLAPSGHNTQPWLFKVSGDTVEVYADRSRSLPAVDPGDRELVMSCGAALFNLRIALRHFGYQAVVEIRGTSDHPDSLARVRLGGKGKATREEEALFQAITRRRTHRLPFEKDDIPASVLDRLRAAASEEGVWLQIIEGEDARHAVAELMTQGDEVQARDVTYRGELQTVVHPNRSTYREGIPAHALGEGGIEAYLNPLAAGPTGEADPATGDRQLATGAPLLVVLGTDANTQRDWIIAGQALERVLLRACVDGVGASFLNQPVEVAGQWPELRRITGRSGFPQVLLRMGYAIPTQATPRRTVREVLIG